MAFTQQAPIGAPDPDLITQTLAKLQPDSALQDYARLHKNDIYIVSLANAESNRRKSLRLAAQRNPGQQPTVVDQSIAGMAPAPVAQTQLPENQGIAQLPTPNMRTLADGGIAGYDEEQGMATGGMGGMFNFAQQSEPVVRMSEGGHVPRYQGNTMDGSVVSSNPMYNIPGMTAVQPRADFTQQGAPENTPFFERIANSIRAQGKEATLFEIETRIKKGVATSEEKAFYQNEKIKGGDTAATDAKYPPQDAIRTKNFPGVKPGFENMPVEMGAPKDRASTDKPPVPPVVNLPTSYKASKAPTIEDATALGEKFSNTKERTLDIKRQVLQEQVDADRAKENSIEALKAFNEKQGPAYAGYEQLLKKEELQDATDKEKAGLMSLMKGFLAMAAGESPNAATNIAKGAMAGLGDYGDALKEFKKAAKERNKEMQNIEQARRSEERGDFKETRMYEDKADTARQASARFGIAAISEITNTGAKISTDIYNTVSTNRSRENVAAMGEAGQNLRTKATIEAQLNTPDRLVFNQLVRDNNNNPVAAAEALQKMKAEKFNLYDSYSKYLTAFANKEGVSPPLPFDQYAKQFIPEVNPNKNTTIRTQPGG